MKARKFKVALVIGIMTVGVFTSNVLQAQVTIGGDVAPKTGAILDLNSDTKGGLLFPNVALANTTQIPGGVFAGITTAEDNNPDLKGMVVYNTYTENGLTAGLYVWNGEDWIKLADDALVVKTTGAQSITGVKTFSDEIVVKAKNSTVGTSETAVATEKQVSDAVAPYKPIKKYPGAYNAYFSRSDLGFSAEFWGGRSYLVNVHTNKDGIVHSIIVTIYSQGSSELMSLIILSNTDAKLNCRSGGNNSVEFYLTDSSEHINTIQLVPLGDAI